MIHFFIRLKHTTHTKKESRSYTDSENIGYIMFISIKNLDESVAVKLY